MAGEYSPNLKAYPQGWQVLRFWQDRQLWWHPVDDNEIDSYSHLLRERPPDWVMERRGYLNE